METGASKGDQDVDMVETETEQSKYKSNISKSNSKENSSDSDWSDIGSDDDGDKSLRIDLKEEEDVEVATLSNAAKIGAKSPTRRLSSTCKKGKK